MYEKLSVLKLGVYGKKNEVHFKNGLLVVLINSFAYVLKLFLLNKSLNNSQH
jgi:hypothetical protein